MRWGHASPISPAASEEVGCTRLSFMDHLFQIGWIGPPELDMLEGYTALGFVASCTSTLRLGLLVTGVTYRHPGMLAKQVSTLDALSGGRAWLGIGAAWNEEEHVGLGVPFPPLAERFERLEEAIQICLQMWSDDDGPFEGKHYQLARTLSVPQSPPAARAAHRRARRTQDAPSRRPLRRRLQSDQQYGGRGAPQVRRPPRSLRA